MRIYLDASAAAKLVFEEAESAAVQRYLDDAGASQVISSVLLETELRRAATAKGVSQRLASDVLASIDLVAAPRTLFMEAGILPLPGLRSLDALHLASALRSEATVLVTYDQRLTAASELMGLAVAAPS